MKNNTTKLVYALIFMVVLLLILYSSYKASNIFFDARVMIEGKVIIASIILLSVFSLIYLLISTLQLINKKISLGDLNALEDKDLKEGIDNNRFKTDKDFVNHIFKPIIEINKRMENIDYKNLISLAYNRSKTKKTFISYIINILIMLGVLGTFIGLLETLGIGNGLGQDKDSINDDITNILSQTFGGVDTAFSTSIIGIINAIALGFLNIYNNRVIESLYIDLEFLVQVRILPLIQDKTTTNEYKILEATQELNTTMTNTASETKQIIEGSLQIFLEDYKEVIKVQVETFKEQLENMMSETTKIITNNNKTYLSSFNSLTTNHQENIEQTKNFIESIGIDVQNNLKNTNQQLTDFGNQYQKQVENYTNLVNKKFEQNNSKVLEDFKELFGEIAEDLERNKKSYKDETKKLLETFKQVLEAYEEKTKTFNDLVNQSDETYKAQNDNIQKGMRKHLTVLENINQTYGKHANNLVLYNSEINNLKNTTKTEMDKLISSIKEVNETQKDLSNHYKGLTEEHIKVSDIFNKLFEIINNK